MVNAGGAYHRPRDVVHTLENRPSCFVLQVKSGHVRTTPVEASGGASGVGASIAQYVESCDADMVVLGSRGLHGWQRYVSLGWVPGMQSAQPTLLLSHAKCKQQALAWAVL